MLIKPKRGQIIKAADIALISERAGRAVVGGLSQVRTSAGAMITNPAQTRVVRAKILDEVWTAKNIAGNSWLAARAQVMRVSHTWQWVDPPPNEPEVAIWWPLFGPVPQDYQVPVIAQYVHAAFLPDSGRYELLSNEPALLPVVVLGTFSEHGYAPAKFRSLVQDVTYESPLIYVFDPLRIFESAGAARGYVFHTYNGGHRYVVVQLEC
jgi:hypothetical protein